MKEKHNKDMPKEANPNREQLKEELFNLILKFGQLCKDENF
jgi:hypothetical protein